MPNDIGSRIKEARIAKHMTQEELARVVGTSKQNIYKYENGIITNIPLDRLEHIARVLSLDPNVLCGWGTAKSDSFVQTHVDVSDQPKTIEARILSAGIDKMPAEDRERALAMMRMIFTQYADYFERSDQNDA